MERPVLTNFFKKDELKKVHESYLNAPELYAYAQSMDNYADYLEEKLNGEIRVSSEKSFCNCGILAPQIYKEGDKCDLCGKPLK